VLLRSSQRRKITGVTWIHSSVSICPSTPLHSSSHAFVVGTSKTEAKPLLYVYIWLNVSSSIWKWFLNALIFVYRIAFWDGFVHNNKLYINRSWSICRIAPQCTIHSRTKDSTTPTSTTSLYEIEAIDKSFIYIMG
jgi:hypothetical protein